VLSPGSAEDDQSIITDVTSLRYGDLADGLNHVGVGYGKETCGYLCRGALVSLALEGGHQLVEGAVYGISPKWEREAVVHDPSEGEVHIRDG
jgi:hypothetical protein